VTGGKLVQEVTIRDEIKKFIVQQFPLAKEISGNDALLGNGILDSLGILEVVGFLEQQFRITIADDDLVPEHFRSIDTITAFVTEKQSAAKA
jgi:acyl carrier protein